MEQLTIVGTEEGKLVLASADGHRFTLPIDDLLRNELRRADRASKAPLSREAQVSPRDIQTHIRAGLAASDVAELLNVGVETVRRFEGPILAEREHIVGRALAVPVLMGVDLDGEPNPTFGSAIMSKLESLHATDERWTSWKEETGWIIKATFISDSVEHDARWTFDPRRSALAPLNSTATQLSRQGPVPEALIPRLRALDATPAPSDAQDDGVFDDTAFDDGDSAATDEARDGLASIVAPPRERAEEPQHADTADLLEALRRKRGQRTSPPSTDREERTEREAARPLSLFDAASDDDTDTSSEAPAQSKSGDDTQPEPTKRRGRASMPSWDEIVFGARAED